MGAERIRLTFQDYLRRRRDWRGKYFTPEELLQSDTAAEWELTNLPTRIEFNMIHEFVRAILDPLRERWCGPLEITSGFRAEDVNAAANGSPMSDHRFQTGCAVDLRPAGGPEPAVQGFYRWLAETSFRRGGKTVYDQIILYPARPQQQARVHFGWRSPERCRFEERRLVLDDGMRTYPRLSWEEIKQLPGINR